MTLVTKINTTFTHKGEHINLKNTNANKQNVLVVFNVTHMCLKMQICISLFYSIKY